MTPYEELRRLLAGDGVVHASPQQPIRNVNGLPAAWALYSTAVTLTGRGLRLAGQVLLERLATFESTQLAAYGQTAQPLLGACVLLGEGRYSGLSVRKQPKASVTGRQVDGPADPRRPVVILDDSIVSGTSLRSSIGALEANGFEVEGALALVEFPHRGGVAWAWASGYRVEAVYDIWNDLEMAGPWFHPAQGFPPDTPRGEQTPDGLPVASAARWIARSYLRTGIVPIAPNAFDAAYDAPGGVFVSFRRRRDDYRLARDGFWRFRPLPSSLGEDLTYATVETIRSVSGAINLASLEDCKIAVTFFGPLVESRPADLDFDRRGIVVRDRLNGRKLGGALPNTQVFTSEDGQYWQARANNARIVDDEEHTLFTHDLIKVVEPGQTWPSYGVPDGPDLAWRADLNVGAAITDLAWTASGQALVGPDGAPEPARTRVASLPDAMREAVIAVGVSLYDRGYLASGLAERDRADISLEGLVAQAARSAVDAMSPRKRAEFANDHARDQLAVTVIVLHDREELGGSRDLARFKVRPGLDALTVRSETGSRTLLPGAGPYNGWDKDELVARLAATPEGRGPGATWSTARTASWVRQPAASGRTRPIAELKSGFVVRAPGDQDHDGQMAAMAEHVLGRLDQSGLPSYSVDAISGRVERRGTAARVIHGLAALRDAGEVRGREDFLAAARRGLEHCLDRVGTGGAAGRVALPGLTPGTLADCVLLDAVVRDDALAGHLAVDALGRRLATLVQSNGRMAFRPIRASVAQDHGILPGAALLALAGWFARRSEPLPYAGFLPQLRWQRGQFRASHGWGLVGWHPQAWRAVHALTGDPDVAAYVFELADWAIDRQLTKNGAFLETFSPMEPSFNTGFIAEGIAAAWGTALRAGDLDRAARYQASWSAAMRFIRSLTFSPDDAFLSRSAAMAIGGVRITPSSPSLRIDATSHCLHAMASGLALSGPQLPPAIVH